MRYLERYAEEEARRATDIPGGPWDEAVVVPVLRESELLDGLLCSLEQASALAGRKTLALLVVNHRKSARERDKLDNLGVLRDYAPSRGIGRGPLDCVWIDRASPGRELDDGNGVGTARKIGCDVAYALKRAGRVRSEFGSTTDGDARVGSDYFTGGAVGVAAGLGQDVSAYVHRFRHEVAESDLPLTLYEIYLRHYVLGLRAAGSPYAFHTVGSLIRFRFSAYAETRGFPKREAGEDFYLLDKLAKIGRVHTHSGRVRLVPRPSDRVPFGTGAAMHRLGDELKRGKIFQLFPDACFRAVGAWQGAVGESEPGWDWERWSGYLIGKGVSREGVAALAGLGFESMAAEASRTRKDPPNYRRHLRTSFGALKTFQWIRALSRLETECDYRRSLRASSLIDLNLSGTETPLELLEKIRAKEEN